jgi:uncharacterized membrane protein SirB2
MYATLKYLHIACVAVSLSGFIARMALATARSRWMQHKFVRIAPHAVDTLLLGAAIGMLAIGQMNPLHLPWLLAKIVGLLAYIGFGTFALKRARTTTGRHAAFVAALLAFSYVASAALTKSAWGFIPIG